jgi:CD109 antigen
LTVETKGYTDKRKLTYSCPQASFLIQTNKAIFRPDDLLQFRVFAIDSETRIENPTGAIVTINDAKGNLIKSFANITFVNGKYQNELQIASRPVLGTWSMTVTLGDQVRYEGFV